MTTHSPELIAALMKVCRPDHLAEDLARELQKVDGLICDIRSAESRLKQAESAMSEARRIYRRDMDDIQYRCQHVHRHRSEYATERENGELYHPIYCAICEKEL
jgi:hypothetical protein